LLYKHLKIKPINSKLNPICHLLALLAHHILHVSGVRGKIYRTTNLLTLREECRLRVFENRMLRRIFGHNRDEVTWEWRKYIMRTLIICTSHPILFGCSNGEE
jgi:hypothetical protein